MAPCWGTLLLFYVFVVLTGSGEEGCYRTRLEAEALTDLQLLARLHKRTILPSTSSHQHKDIHIHITPQYSTFTIHHTPDNMDTAFDILQVMATARRAADWKKRGRESDAQQKSSHSCKSASLLLDPREEPTTTFRSNFTSLAQQTGYRKELLKALLDPFIPLLRNNEKGDAVFRSGPQRNVKRYYPEHLNYRHAHNQSSVHPDSLSRDRDPNRTGYQRKPKRIKWKQSYAQAVDASKTKNRNLNNTAKPGGGLLSLFAFWKKSPKKSDYNLTGPAQWHALDQYYQNH